MKERVAGVRMPGGVLHPILAACALLLLAVGARAEALRAEFSPLTLRPRVNAPAIFDLKLVRTSCSRSVS